MQGTPGDSRLVDIDGDRTHEVPYTAYRKVFLQFQWNYPRHDHRVDGVHNTVQLWW